MTSETHPPFAAGGHVTGTGMLALEWFDSTHAVVDIWRIDPGASILAIPEPGTPGLLMMAVLALLLHRHRDSGRPPLQSCR